MNFFSSIAYFFFCFLQLQVKSVAYVCSFKCIFGFYYEINFIYVMSSPMFDDTAPYSYFFPQLSYQKYSPYVFALFLSVACVPLNYSRRMLEDSYLKHLHNVPQIWVFLVCSPCSSHNVCVRWCLWGPVCADIGGSSSARRNHCEPEIFFSYHILYVRVL